MTKSRMKNLWDIYLIGHTPHWMKTNRKTNKASKREKNKKQNKKQNRQNKYINIKKNIIKNTKKHKKHKRKNPTPHKTKNDEQHGPGGGGLVNSGARIFNKSYTTGFTNGTRTAYLSSTAFFYSRVHLAQSLVYYLVFHGLLILVLSLFCYLFSVFCQTSNYGFCLPFWYIIVCLLFVI